MTESFLKIISTAKTLCCTDQRSMANEMLWVSLEGRSGTNSPRQRFLSQLCYQIVRYFCQTLYLSGKITFQKIFDLSSRTYFENWKGMIAAVEVKNHWYNRKCYGRTASLVWVHWRIRCEDGSNKWKWEVPMFQSELQSPTLLNIVTQRAYLISKCFSVAVLFKS
jgi:hypothetical protein